MSKETEYGRRISLRLPEELACEIEIFTKERGMSITEFLRRACREKLDREKGEAAPTEYLTRDEVEKMIREVVRSECGGKK